MYEQITATIQGTAPLIHHNGHLVDPANEFVKAISKISKKRGKTDDDHAEMSRLEFFGGLYLNKGKPCLPAHVLESAIHGGAKKSKLGKLFSAGVFVEKDAMLEYKGPKDPEKLFENSNFVLKRAVKIGMSKIIRTRPIFNEWKATFELSFEPSVIDRTAVIQAIEHAGLLVGVGDWRPRHGRFEVLEAN